MNTDQQAFEEWQSRAGYRSDHPTSEHREEAWNAALAWLRSQGEPVAWMYPRAYGSGLAFVKPVTCCDEEGDVVNPVPLFLAPQPVIPDGWQPIETAPKDFEPFDVWSARDGRIPDCTDGMTTYGKKRGIVFQSGYDSDGPIMDLIEDATHWIRVAAPKLSK